MRRKILLTLTSALTLCLCSLTAFAQTPKPLPRLREQADIQQQWLRLRLERVLPALMRRQGVEMWLVICREYNEDPVYRSLSSPTVFAARRRTILVFHDKGDRVDRLALGGGSNGGLYQVYRDPETENRELYGEGQWAVLRKLIAERNPKTIGVNISATHAFSDGLSAGEWEKLQTTLDDKYKQRIKRAEELPLEYIATRLPEQLPIYRLMQEHVHSLLARAFSSEVITPGKTTSQDVVWWLRQQTHDLGFGTWFQTTVRVQRQGSGIPSNLAEDAPVVIERGDVLHCDYGLTAMGLATDTQHMAYVLKPGEQDAPPGIQAALLNTNRMQDILMSEMKPGRTGNEVLASSIARMKAEKINGTFYTHPIGDHGHGAGPLIGLWDRQEGVPGRGDVRLIPNMWHSIELGARTPVAEWGGQELFVGQEEDAVMDEAGRMSWALRRQTKYHLIR
jgi:Xaa-Pro aminopeptidase